MAETIEVLIDGWEQLVFNSHPQLLAGPMRRFLERAASAIEAHIKGGTPVDTGRLRASMTHRLEATSIPLWATIGTNVEYAEELEFSTRRPRRTGRIPYFRPGIRDAGPTIQAALSRAHREIEDAWGRR